MRMYLSSFRMGDHPERLVELLDPPEPAAVIANAIDGASDDDRREGVERELGALAELGLDAEELDLRDYVGAAAAAEATATASIAANRSNRPRITRLTNGLKAMAIRSPGRRSPLLVPRNNPGRMRSSRSKPIASIACSTSPLVRR